MSDNFDEELAREYRAGRKPAAPGRPTCPTPDQLLAALRGEGNEGDRTKVLDHALSCQACQPELALLQAVSDPKQQLAVARTTPAQRWWPLALAATALLAVGVLRSFKGPGDDVVRSGDDGPALVLPARDAEVTAAGPVAFVWHSTPGALRYEVELTSTDGTVLASSTTSDTTASLTPPAAAAGAARWWVKVRRDDGSEQRSEARALRLR